MLSTSLAYAAVSRNLPAQLDAVAQLSPVEREIAYFRENIGSVTTADELIDDPRLFRFAVTAFDLESQVQSRGLFRQMLSEDFSASDSLVNRLRDPKYTVFAAIFQFPGAGEENVKDPELVDSVVERYKRVRLEQRQGEQSPGARLALYFDRTAADVTNYYTILADRPLREFFFTAFNLPDSVQAANPDRLVEILERRFDIEDLQDPEARAGLIRQFAAMYDVRNPAAAAVSPLASLVAPVGAGPPPIAAIDASALFALRSG